MSTSKETDYAEMTLDDATFEELIFWEKVFVSVCSANDCKSSSTARAWATRAVLHRREVFSRLVSDEV